MFVFTASFLSFVGGHQVSHLQTEVVLSIPTHDLHILDWALHDSLPRDHARNSAVYCLNLCLILSLLSMASRLRSCQRQSLRFVDRTSATLPLRAANLVHVPLPVSQRQSSSCPILSLPYKCDSNELRSRLGSVVKPKVGNDHAPMTKVHHEITLNRRLQDAQVGRRCMLAQTAKTLQNKRSYTKNTKKNLKLRKR